MTRTILSILFLLPVLFISAQKEANDPKATAVLKEVQDKMKSMPQFEMNYVLRLKFPEQPEEVQQGKLVKKGKAFRLSNDLQTVISDGTTIWVHLKDLNEIQIMDASDESIAGILDPETFLSEFVEGQFVYAITGESTEAGSVIQQIEFKPVDPASEYAKLRLSVAKDNKALVGLESFQKDGSRYTIRFDKVITSPVITSDTFRFDPGKFPGAHIEDLRM